MTAVWQTNSAQGNASGATYTGICPTGVVTGDLMLAQILIRGGANTISTTPTGWNNFRNDNNAGSTADVILSWKIATASDVPTTSTYAWTGSLAGVNSVVISRITGFDPTTPINISNVALDSAAGTTHAGATVTTTVADCLLLHMCASTGGSTSTGTIPTPPIEVYDATQSGTANGNRWEYGATETLATASTSTSRTVTSTASYQSVNQTVAIAPAPAAAAAASDIAYTPPAYMVDFY